MNRVNSCLDRLFRAAGRCPAPLPAEAPFILEAQVLAAWRDGLEEDCSFALLPLFRGAMACACAIIVISVALTLHSWVDAPPSEMIILDSAIQLTLMQ
jgi:hypothetical protein